MEGLNMKKTVITAHNAYDSAVAKLKALLSNPPPKRRDANVTVAMQMLHKVQIGQTEKNVAETLSKLQLAKRNFKNGQLRESTIIQSVGVKKGNNSAPKPGEKKAILFPHFISFYVTILNNDGNMVDDLLQVT